MTQTELAPYIAPWLGPTGQPAFYRQVAQMDERYGDEIEARLDRIRCPVTIPWGEEDQWIPAAQGTHLRAKIPGSSLRLVAKAGHLMQEDAPEAIVAALYELEW